MKKKAVAPARRKVPATPGGASAETSSHTGLPSTVRSRSAAMAASITGTTRDSTGSGQPERQHAPACRQA